MTAIFHRSLNAASVTSPVGKLLKEFREFATRGNAIDLAIGLVIGSAFTGE